MPDRHLVSDEHQDGQNPLENREKRSYDGNHLKPGLEVKKVDIEGEKADRQHREPEYKRMILFRRGSCLSFRFSKMMKEALKFPPAVSRKDHPGDDHHAHRIPKRSSGTPLCWLMLRMSRTMIK